MENLYLLGIRARIAGANEIAGELPTEGLLSAQVIALDILVSLIQRSKAYKRNALVSSGLVFIKTYILFSKKNLLPQKASFLKCVHYFNDKQACNFLKRQFA